MTEGTRTRRVGSGYMFIIFGLTFALGAFMIVVLSEPADILLLEAESASSTQESAEGLGYVRDAWAVLPWTVALFGFIGLFANAALSRARGGFR